MSPGPDPALWSYDEFVFVHLQWYSNNHSTPQFFTWHRRFIEYYERALSTVGWNSGLPYWDWV
jgi:hypothetical protein